MTYHLSLYKERHMLEALYIIIALGVTILVHELGHFLTAKALNIRVEAFSIGFGPEIVSWKRGDTEYRIGWLIFLGGYVKLSGEDPDKVDVNDKKAFLNQHPFKKILVAVSGVIQNFIFAFVLVWIVFMAGTETLKPVVGDAAKGLPAYEAGVKKGDIIAQVNGKNTANWDEFEEALLKGGSKELTLLLKRDGADVTVKLKPKMTEIENILKEKKTIPDIGLQPLAVLPVIDIADEKMPAYKAGLRPGDEIVKVNSVKTESSADIRSIIEKSSGSVLITVKRHEKGGAAAPAVMDFKVDTIEKEFYNSGTKTKEKTRIIGISFKQNTTVIKYGITEAAVRGWNKTIEMCDLTVKSVYKMLVRQIPADIAGPLGVIKISYEVAKVGIIEFMFLFALININLAMVNFLPILPLDGGLSFMFIIELITGKKVPLKIQEALMQFGWFLLISLLVFATYKDLLRFISGG